tara:strand:- start:233 stop:1069 length:837 start_codon:yes stop_codon:yes gene_type:complete
MIIWIASYPKSGNTWVRLFLKAYFSLLNNKVFNINSKNEKISSFYSFPNIGRMIDLNIDYTKFEEIAKNWIFMQDRINLNNKTNFLKTHNAMCTINNNKFTDKNNTLGAIYLVRDPRDIVISYSHHLGKSNSEVVENLLNPMHYEYAKHEDNTYRNTIMGKWSDHYNSWKSYKTSKLLFLRYEDLINNSIKSFSKILKYLNQINGLEFDEKKMLDAINQTSFKNLQKQEDLYGFNEQTGKGRFFRKGQVGDYLKNLDNKLINKIEKTFYKEMKELNYL